GGPLVTSTRMLVASRLCLGITGAVGRATGPEGSRTGGIHPTLGDHPFRAGLSSCSGRSRADRLCGISACHSLVPPRLVESDHNRARLWLPRKRLYLLDHRGCVRGV